MPTNVNSFSLWGAAEAFDRALNAIKQADGFNTSPVVQFGSRSLDSVPAGEFPFLAFELGDMDPDVEQTGGNAPSHGLIRFVWPAFVFGYVKTSGNRRDLYRAGAALLADVLAAVYLDETLPDGNGQGTVLMIHPGKVTFDMESFATDGRGWFVAEFGLVVDVDRSGTP
jgi:hypothetical protein